MKKFYTIIVLILGVFVFLNPNSKEFSQAMDYYAMEQLQNFKDSTQLEDYKLLSKKPYLFKKVQFFLFSIYRTEIKVEGVRRARAPEDWPEELKSFYPVNEYPTAVSVKYRFVGFLGNFKRLSYKE